MPPKAPEGTFRGKEKLKSAIIVGTIVLPRAVNDIFSRSWIPSLGRDANRFVSISVPPLTPVNGSII